MSGSYRGKPESPRSVLWLGAGLDFTFSILMLYMPFYFQGDLYRYMYGHLRPFGALFFCAGILLTLDLADLRLPRWVGRAGHWLTILGLGSFVVTHTRASGLSPGMAAYLVIVAALVAVAWRPQLDRTAFRTVYGSILTMFGTALLIARIQHGEIGLPWWVDLLFLVPGLIHLLVQRQLAGRRWIDAAVTLVASAPLLWYTYVWMMADNWLGAGVTGTLAAGALLQGLFLLRPWHVTLPRLRRRVLALGLVLAMVPCVVVGAIAVYYVQNLAFEQGAARLVEEVGAMERALTAVEPGLTILPEAPPDVTLRVMTASDLPTAWNRGDHPRPFEVVTPGGVRLLVAYIRHAQTGRILLATSRAHTVYMPARQSAARILVGTLTAGLLAALLSLLFSQRITRRLAHLQAAVGEIGLMRFEVGTQLMSHEDDEIAGLSSAIGQMSAALVQRDRYQEANARRQAATAVLGRQVPEHTTVQGLLDQVVRQVREVLGAQWCCIVQKTAEHSALRLKACVGIMPAGLPEGLSLDSGGLPALPAGSISHAIENEQFSGFLVVGMTLPAELEESDLLFVKTVAHIVASALERLCALYQVKAEQALAAVLSASDDLDQAAPALLEAIGQSLDWSAGIFWVVAEGGQRLQCLAAWTAPSLNGSRLVEVSRSFAPQAGEGLPGVVWETGRPIWRPALGTDPTFTRREAAAADGLSAAAVIPAIVGNQVLGVLEFFAAEMPQAAASLHRTLEAMGQQVGQFLQRKRAEVAREHLLKAERAARTRQVFLAEASAQLSDLMDPQDLVNRVARLPLPILADCAVLHPAIEGLLPSLAHIDPDLEQAGLQLFRDELPEQVYESEQKVRLAKLLGIRSYLIVPITAKGRYLGALTLGLTDPDRHFGPEDQAVAIDLASRIALSLDNAVLHRAVQRTLRALEESHARLDTLVTAAPVGVALIDLDLRFLQINEALARMTGTPEADHLGRQVTAVLPALGPTLEELFRHVLKTGVPLVNTEVAGQTPADPGVDRYWLATAYPIRLSNGELVGLGAIVADFTERKRMEQAVRESEALLSGKREVLEKIATGQPLLQCLEAIARFVDQRVPGDSRCEIRLAEGSGIPDTPAADPAARRSVPIPNMSGGTAGALSIVHQPGQPLSEKTLRSLETAARLAGIAIERHRLEEGRIQKMHSVLQHMAEGVIAVGEDRRLLFTNPAAARLLELPAVDPSLPIEAVALPGPLARMLDKATQPEASQPERLTFQIGPRDIEAHVSPVFTDLGRYGAVAVVQDVTAQAQFRRLQESFVANVSHELRGPLASLSATLEALVDGLIPEANRDRYLRSMLAEMERLRRLSYEVVELTRLDSGVFQFEREPIDVRELLEAVAQKTAHRCAKANLTLSVDAPLVVCLGDYDRVDQVLSGLLDNAIQHTPAGGRIHLAAACVGDAVRFTVSDTGVGIQREHLPLIWERFYKVDQARTLRPGKGTGLGLAIVKKLVEGMGGQVDVESVPNRGSTFGFTVPVPLPSEAAAG